MAEQPFVRLNDGRRYPQLGFGTWQIADEQASDAVQQALKIGYRHIDTAYGYGNERGVGEGVRESGLPREDIFVTTKLTARRLGYDNALRTFEESADKLGLGPVDLYLIHWPAPAQNLYVETWKAFIRLREEGRVKSIGVSNFNIDHLERLIGETGVTPAANQIELHPHFQQRNARDFHKRHAIAIESWSPLGSGRLIGDPTLEAIGAKYGKSGAQIMLRWHLQEGLIVLPKSSSPQRMQANFDLFDFELDAEDMRTIAAMDKPDGRYGLDPEQNN